MNSIGESIQLGTFVFYSWICLSRSHHHYIASSSVRLLWNETWLIDFSKKRWRVGVQLCSIRNCHLSTCVPSHRLVVKAEWWRMDQWKHRKQCSFPGSGRQILFPSLFLRWLNEVEVLRFNRDYCEENSSQVFYRPLEPRDVENSPTVRERALEVTKKDAAKKNHRLRQNQSVGPQPTELLSSISFYVGFVFKVN